MSAIRKKNKHADKSEKRIRRNTKSKSDRKIVSEVCVLEHLVPADLMSCCEVEYCCLV